MFDLLFKQLGFNPADLKKQVDDAAKNFNAVINHFNARLDTIEENQTQITQLLEKVLLHVEPDKKILENNIMQLNGETHDQ